MYVIYYQVVLCKLLTIFYSNKDRSKTSPQPAKVEIKKKENWLSSTRAELGAIWAVLLTALYKAQIIINYYN